MNRLLMCVFLFVGALNLTACSSGFDKKAQSVDWSKGPVVVLSASLKNEYRPSFNATGLNIKIATINAPSQQLDVLISNTVKDDMGILVTQLLPGSYRIKNVGGFAFNVLIVGGFSFEVDSRFTVRDQRGVIYLGHIAATNIEKTDKNDQASGGVLPIIDQAVSGFAGGTLKINLEDRYDLVSAKLKEDYQSLRDYPLERNLLTKIALKRDPQSSAKPIVVVGNLNAGANDNMGAPVSKLVSASSSRNTSVLHDADRLPYVGESGKKAYQQWLQSKTPRAFVVGINEQGKTSYGWANGDKPTTRSVVQSSDPLVRALAACRVSIAVDCKPYAIDDEVVWKE
jgi:hypothetical protein